MIPYVPAWRYSQNIVRYRSKPASLFTIHFGAFVNYNDLVNYFKYNPDRRYADSTWCIGQEGQACQMVNLNDTPWTNGSGLGVWTDEQGQLTSLINDIAFTVETSNNSKNGYFVYTPAQYETLAQIFKWTLVNFPYTHVTRINGHEHMVCNYKVDPGPLFDWEKFLVDYVGMKQEIYNEYMKFLQEASQIKGNNWYTGITAAQAEIKKKMCIEGALKIAKDIKHPSTYYMK